MTTLWLRHTKINDHLYKMHSPYDKGLFYYPRLGTWIDYEWGIIGKGTTTLAKYMQDQLHFKTVSNPIGIKI